jgi:hypothetical protein
MVVDTQSLWISRTFWILFTLEAVGFTALMFWTPRGARTWGPEGPVGGWLVYVVPPILLAIPLAVVLIGRSHNANLCGLVLVAWPIVPVVVGPIYSAFDNYCTDRRVAGDFNFFLPSQRKLAHALTAHDVARVRELLPHAGDLNADHWGESLFAFGLSNSDKSDASVEIVKAMLDHGANPNLVTPNRCHVLTMAIGNGPAMTKLLLDRGANLNSLEAETGRPIWWDVLFNESPDGLATLKILLDHGADLTRRDSYNGPVGWATHHKNWPAVWLLMERGAAWKNETAFGQPILSELDGDVGRRRGMSSGVPEEMAKIRARYEAEPSAK